MDALEAEERLQRQGVSSSRSSSSTKSSARSRARSSTIIVLTCSGVPSLPALGGTRKPSTTSSASMLPVLVTLTM